MNEVRRKARDLLIGAALGGALGLAVGFWIYLLGCWAGVLC